MSGSGARRSFELVPSSRWVNKHTAERCAKCGKSFGLFRPPDNCQSCGRVFCTSSCLDNAMVLPGHPGTAPVPVCDECATSNRRVQQDSEMAVHRCQILEELLNEQTLQAENLIKQSKELRGENESLVKEKEALQGEVKKLELQLEVAVARNNLLSGGASDAGGGNSSGAASPVSSTSKAGAGTSSPLPSNTDGAEEEKRLEKKKKLLDMREATLQEALKKVSNDAAKIVSQRAALQEQERSLQETVTERLTQVFQSQRAALEESILAERQALRESFTQWMEELQEGRVARASPAETQTAANEEAVSKKEAPCTSAALEAEHAVQLEGLRKAHEEELTNLRNALETAQTSLHAAETSLAERERDLASMKELQRRAKTWEDDKLILQGSVGALKRAAEEAQAKVAETQERVEQLEAERRQWEASVQERERREQELREQFEATQQAHAAAEAREAQQDRAAAEAQAFGAVQELQAKLDATGAELDGLKSDHKAACEQYEALIARLELDVKEAKKEKDRAVSAERQKRAALHAKEMQDLKERHTREGKEVLMQHEAKLEELEKKHAARVKELKDELKKEKERRQHTATAAKSKDGGATEQLMKEQEQQIRSLKDTVATLEKAQAESEARWHAQLAEATTELALLRRQQQESEQAWHGPSTGASPGSTTTHAVNGAADKEELESLRRENAQWRSQCASLQTELQSLAERGHQPPAPREDGTAVEPGRPLVPLVGAGSERDGSAANVTEVSLTSDDEDGADGPVISPPAPLETEPVVDMPLLASCLLEEVRLVYKISLEEQAAGLVTGLSYLHAATAASTAALADTRRREQQQAEALAAAETEHKEAVTKLQRQLKAAKREGQSHEQRATELAQEVLQHKRALSAQTEEVAQLKEKLKKAQKAVTRAEKNASAAMAAVPPPLPSVAKSDPVTDPSVAMFAAAALRWERNALALLLECTSRIGDDVLTDLMAAARGTEATMAAALEKYKEVGRRNVAALEQTTSTIRTVQADLRAKAQELTEREVALSSREAKLAAHSAALKRKREAVKRVCDGLHVVVARLREREEELPGYCNDALAAVTEGSAALLADDGRGGSETNGTRATSP